MSETTPLSRRQRAIIVAISLVQSLLLLFLFLMEINEDVTWEAGAESGLRWSAWTLAAGLPILLQLILGHGRPHQIALALSVGAVLLGSMARYMGGAVADGRADEHPISYLTTVALVMVIFLAFARTAMEPGGLRFPYPRLAYHAWSSGLTLLLALMVCVGLWLPVALVLGIFSALGADTLVRSLYSPWFFFPVSGLMMGLAMVLSRTKGAAADALAEFVRLLCWGLLPMLALITLGVALLLAIVGPQRLWDAGFSSGLLLGLVLANVAFIAMVFGDGSEPPDYGRFQRRLLTLAVLALPALTAVAAYGVHLRVAYHGWSEGRVLAALAALILAGYALCYLVAFLRRGAPRLATVNRVMALVVALVAFLTYTPLLNPSRISVENQMARLLDGRVQAEYFDFRYLRFDAGRFGTQALARLTELRDHPDAEMIRTAAYQMQKAWRRYKSPAPPRRPLPLDEVTARFPVRSGEADPEFLAYLADSRDQFEVRTCFEVKDMRCLLVPVNLDGRDGDEYVLIMGGAGRFMGREREDRIPVYRRDERGWRRVAHLAAESCVNCNLVEAARTGDIELAPARWPDLVVDGRRFQVQEAWK